MSDIMLRTIEPLIYIFKAPRDKIIELYESKNFYYNETLTLNKLRGVITLCYKRVNLLRDDEMTIVNHPQFVNVCILP
jgi:hypothetical protein